MPRDLRELLDDTAASPSSYPGSSELIRRGRRRRRTQRGAGAGVLVALAMLGVFLIPRLPPRPSSVIFQQAPTASAQPHRAEPEDLLGRTFISTQVQRPEGPLLPGTRIRLSLWREGKEGAGWKAGCNGSTGTLKVEERTLHIRQTSTTLMGCGEGNDQDEWVARFLESGPRWELGGDTLTLSQGDRRVTFRTVDDGPLARATAAPEASAQVGPRLDIRSLPRLSREGLAVAVDDNVVLIGLDGTVHGHIPGRLATGAFYGFEPKRQGLTNLLRVEPDDGTISWVDPPSGRYLEGYEQAAPLWASSRVVYDAHGGPQEEMQVDGGFKPEKIGWPGNSQWFVSADHRLVTWLPCNDGGCAPKFYDSDMAGIGDLESGCRAAHAFADFVLTLICDNGRSIVSPEGAGGAFETIPVPPAADGAQRRFVAVYDNGIVRVDTPGCRSSAPYEIRSGKIRPVEADGAITGSSLVPLGVVDDGRIVVHANADAQCGLTAPAPGVYVLDPDTGEATRVWAGAAAVNEVQFWAPTGASLSKERP